MALQTVVMDHRAAESCSCGAPTSLLVLPLGRRAFLERITERIDGLSGRAGQPLFVVPDFTIDDEYIARVKAICPGARVVTSEQVAERCGASDPSDMVLVIDPSRWPLDDVNLTSLVRRHGKERVATHFVGVGTAQEGARERVEHDEEGRVKSVQRLYDGTAQPELAVSGAFMTLAPALMLKGLRFRSVAELRGALAEQGLLSRDAPLEVDVLDLRGADGVLLLNERMAAEETRQAPRGEGRNGRSGVLIGKGCRVDPRARLVGPVILHDGVTVAAGSTVVGPAVIGAGSALEAGSIVAQAVLAPGTLVRSGVTLRHCIASGRCNVCSADAIPADPVRLTAPPLTSTPRPTRQSRAKSTGGEPRRRVHLAIKRLVDIVASSVGLVVLSPLLITVAILIKLRSPGPVFFVHRREQRGGKEFPCLKFRTMIPNAHAKQLEMYAQNELDGPQFKLRDDPRVTPLGKWLREKNVDELPQLFNVLAGQMSLVGPRPSPFRENQICVPWRRARLSVRPGITGLWQICRSTDRSGGDFHEWIYYDIAYVRNFSIWLDLRILYYTITTKGGRRSVPMAKLIPGEHRATHEPHDTPTSGNGNGSANPA